MGALLLREYRKGIIHGALGGLTCGLFWSGAWSGVKTLWGMI